MNKRVQNLLLLFPLLITFSTVFVYAQKTTTTGAVSAIQPSADGVTFRSGDALVRLTVVRPGIMRLRYAIAASFPADHSFAVVPEAKARDSKAQFTQSATALKLSDGETVATVERATGRIVFTDKAGNVILADHPNYPATWHGKEFRVYKTMPALEQYFGLGDKSDASDHRGAAVTMWNTDAFGWQQGSDPLYKSIPFFVGLNNGRAYGVFLDNTYKSSFDFGKESVEYFSFGATGGELNYYFIAGPEPKQVIARYTELTGRTPLPALWTLGYQQCRYSYYPESRVRQIANEFRTRKIPADVIWLDIDYQEGYKPFTINRKYFPTFEQMVKDLGEQGFKMVVISDLHIKKETGYKPYDEGTAGDHFIKNPDGSQYVGKVWPGDSVFPEFTLASARKFYGSQFKMFTDMGIAGIWNDMNEPAVFRYPDKTMPLDTVHRVDSETENRNPAGPIRKTDHREIHNVLGLENVRATYEGLLALRPNERPFVMTRAAYAGSQRYAATWTGDNQSSWLHFRLSLPTLLNLGVSGYPLAGNDVGGFDGSPTPDLLTRWLELGVFFPIYRDHTTNGTRDQEPWVHGPEHEAIRKRYIETRYRLLPYIYTSMEETSRTGIPLMRSFFVEHPLLGRMENINDKEYFFGRDLLVAPKVLETVDPYEVVLPGPVWYDYWTGKKIEAKQEPAWDKEHAVGIPVTPMVGKIKVDPKLDELPVYVRGGAILPHEPLIQTTAEKPLGPLELRVYPGPDCSGSVYSDDGHTFDYKQGHYFRQSFTCEATAQGVTVTLGKAEGDYTPWWTQVKVTVYGGAEPVSKDVPFSREAQTVSVTY